MGESGRPSRRARWVLERAIGFDIKRRPQIPYGPSRSRPQLGMLAQKPGKDLNPTTGIGISTLNVTVARVRGELTPLGRAAGGPELEPARLRGTRRYTASRKVSAGAGRGGRFQHGVGPFGSGTGSVRSGRQSRHCERRNGVLESSPAISSALLTATLPSSQSQRAKALRAQV